MLFWTCVIGFDKDREDENCRSPSSLSSTLTPNVQRACLCVCVSASLSLWGLWLLLEDIVDQDLKEDEENDDDVVALLEEGTTLHPACRTTPQHADAPTNTQEL